MLQRGDLVRHFAVTTLDGRRIDYANIWQHRNLVLVALPASDSEASRNYVSELGDRIPQFRAQHTDCVMTRENVPGLPHPSAVVADKWGEIVYIHAASEIADLPSADDLSGWIDYVESRCPECEGEAK